MAVTRSQDGDPKEKDVETEDPFESRISKLEAMVAEQHTAMMKHMAEMFGAMSGSTANKVIDDQSNSDRSTPLSSQSTENRSGTSDPYRAVRHHPARSEVHQAYGNLTRLGKIDFPRFDGTRIKDWLFKVEEFFCVDSTPEHLKGKMAAIHFDGQASTWIQDLILYGVGLEALYDWKGYVKLLRERFDDDCDDDQPLNGEFGESVEHRMVNLVPEAQEENPKLENHEGWEQIVILEVDGDVEKSQNVVSNTKLCSAHQVFDQMPSKEKQRKCLKAWKFKFKSTSKRSKSMDDMFSFVEEAVLLKKDPKETIWDCVKKEFKETMAACGKNRVDRFKLAEEKESRLQVLDLNQTFMYHQIGHGVDILLVSKMVVHDKEMAVVLQRATSLTTCDCPDRSSRANRVWKPGGLLCVQDHSGGSIMMITQRNTKQELSYWSVANHVKRDAQESFGYNLIVAYMENKKTWTKLRVRKHDNLIWKEDISDGSRSRPSRCIVKLGDATITCKNLLEKSYDKNLDTVAWRNRPGRSEISNEEDQGNLQSRIGFSFSRGKNSTFISQAMALLSESKVWTEKQIPTLQILKQVNKSQYRWTQVHDVNRFLMWRHLHLNLDCEETKLAGRKRNHGLLIRLHSKQKQRKCPKSWMFKFKTGSKLAGTSHLKRHKESGLGAQIRGVRKQSKLLLLSLCPSFLCRAMLRVTVKQSKHPKTWSFKFKLRDVLAKELERTS